MNERILELKNITKDFIGVRALNDVSFDVKKGEVHSIIGENGAGKTTLMKVLSGAYPCTSYDGEILCKGDTQHFHTPRHAKEAGIEMIYQEVHLIPELSVIENIMVGDIRRKMGFMVDWNAMESDAKRILDEVGLDIDPEEKARKLSTSQQQMVAIAKSTIKKPMVLVLDEPTSSLTNNEKENLFKIINKLKNLGISSIYISHKIEEVIEISDRISIMRDGNIIKTLEQKDFDIDNIITLMVGRTLDNRYPARKKMPGDEVLRVESLTVPHPYIKDRKLVQDVSFSLKKGEVLGIGGLVGAGRSELVNAIFGYLKPEPEYKIFIEGEERRIDSIKSAIKNGIALLTEDRRATGIIPALSIRENATIVSLKKMSKYGVISHTKEKEILNDYIGKLNIKANDTETRIKTLSGGNQQKVVMSKWLIQKPKVMILDEPTRGIDVGAKFEIYNLINALTEEGMSFIIISSELPELLGMCDRFIVLCNGRITAGFDQCEATEDRIVAAATGVSIKNANKN